MVIDSGGVWRFGQPGVMEGGQFFLAALVQFARQLLAAESRVTPLETFQDQVHAHTFVHCTHVVTVGYVTVLVLWFQKLEVWETVSEMVAELTEMVGI